MIPLCGRALVLPRFHWSSPIFYKKCGRFCRDNKIKDQVIWPGPSFCDTALFVGALQEAGGLDRLTRQGNSISLWTSISRSLTEHHGVSDGKDHSGRTVASAGKIYPWLSVGIWSPQTRRCFDRNETCEHGLWRVSIAGIHHPDLHPLRQQTYSRS